MQKYEKKLNYAQVDKKNDETSFEALFESWTREQVALASSYVSRHCLNCDSTKIIRITKIHFPCPYIMTSSNFWFINPANLFNLIEIVVQTIAMTVYA
jgi:hypothetical protein